MLHRKKVPFTPGRIFASSTRPSSWCDYTTARAALADKRGQFDGVGFVLNGDGIACLDLDDCLHDGVLEAWAQEIVDRCPRTYIEISPSGHGLHVFGYATVGKGRIGQVEVYDRARYICITGRRFGSFPRRLADISAVVASV